MPEWLIERGIGETRAALVEHGVIVESRVLLDGVLPAGSRVEARLANVGTGDRNALARTADGLEILLPARPPSLSEGASLTVEITREAIPGAEPWKRPLGRVSDSPAAAAPLPGRPARAGELDAAGWDDLVEEARSGVVRFPGGSLTLYAAPAMTLIDVDGSLLPEELAALGASEAARAVRRLNIGGSIGIDLPTAGNKAARQNAAREIDAILPQPFERTGVNGFGFIQIVRPRRNASLLELAQDRPAFETRALLRRAALEPPGAKRVVANPAVTAVLEAKPEWTAALSRQLGGAIGLRADRSLPMSGGHAEKA